MNYKVGANGRIMMRCDLPFAIIEEIDDPARHYHANLLKDLHDFVIRGTHGDTINYERFYFQINYIGNYEQKDVDLKQAAIVAANALQLKFETDLPNIINQNWREIVLMLEAQFIRYFNPPANFIHVKPERPGSPLKERHIRLFGERGVEINLYSNFKGGHTVIAEVYLTGHGMRLIASKDDSSLHNYMTPLYIRDEVRRLYKEYLFYVKKPDVDDEMEFGFLISIPRQFFD